MWSPVSKEASSRIRAGSADNESELANDEDDDGSFLSSSIRVNGDLIDEGPKVNCTRICILPTTTKPPLSLFSSVVNGYSNALPRINLFVERYKI